MAVAQQEAAKAAAAALGRQAAVSLPALSQPALSSSLAAGGPGGFQPQPMQTPHPQVSASLQQANYMEAFSRKHSDPKTNYAGSENHAPYNKGTGASLVPGTVKIPPIVCKEKEQREID